MGVAVFRILVFVLVNVWNPAGKIDIIVGMVVVAFSMPVEVISLVPLAGPCHLLK